MKVHIEALKVLKEQQKLFQYLTDQQKELINKIVDKE